MKIRTLLLPLILLVLLSGCGPNTQMTATWKNPEFVAGNKATKIFVAVMAANKVVRLKLEDALADEITRRGGKAVRSYERFPMSVAGTNSIKLNTSETINSIRESGCDAIMVVALLDKKEETHYVPGSAGYIYPGATYGYYGSYGGYYDHYASVVYSPGYYESIREYYLETSIFNAITEKIVWTGQSTTSSPANVDAFIRDYKAALLGGLKRDKVIK
ncbi:MAG: hypothetical protein WCO63_00550 [Bacteroidota bacterium]